MFVLLTVLLVALGFAAGWWLHPKAPEEAPLPVLGQVPDYTLTDQLGQQVSSTALLGKVRVVTFLFTYCTEYCPLVAHEFVSLEGVLEVAGLADRVQLVAFNVDPGATGPDQMRAFQQQYGWNPHDTRWEFLTGPAADIHRIVAGAYHVDYRKVVEGENGAGAADSGGVPELQVRNDLAEAAGVDYDIVHNDMLAIVDTRGRIRKIFGDADRVPNEALLDVIRRLLAEDTGPAALPTTAPAAGGGGGQ